jgi:hypothetical protein
MLLTEACVGCAACVLQLHKTPQGVCYFSRRGREHGELTNYNVFDSVLHTQVRNTALIVTDVCCLGKGRLSASDCNLNNSQCTVQLHASTCNPHLLPLSGLSV